MIETLNWIQEYKLTAKYTAKIEPECCVTTIPSLVSGFLVTCLAMRGGGSEESLRGEDRDSGLGEV